MTFGSALYKLLIGPLELMFEVIFTIADRLVGNHGIAIIFLSLAINFLVLPLYRRADAMQQIERKKTEEMRPAVEHIKKTFKGNERFMMLQTLYRQHQYKQTDVFKGSVSLLLQIPFFTAAYRFLSNLELLKGMSFGPIADMGAPDGLLVIGGVALNLLPILMTTINFISASIYMRGFPLKSKLQTYLLALAFLVLLYRSPAGLVFYWTLNNLFSLLKNVFYKLKNPGLVLGILFSIISVAGLVFTLVIHPLPTMRRKFFVALILLALQLPLVVALLKKKQKKTAVKAEAPQKAPAGKQWCFLLGCLFLTVLTGVLIPSAVIHDSTAEFVDLLAMKSPLQYVLTAALLAAGTFIIWFGIFYRLADEKGKKLLNYVIVTVGSVAAVDYLFFGRHFGNLSSMLQFDDNPVWRFKETALNLAVVFAIALVIFFIWKKKPSLLQFFIGALCFAVVGMSAVNLFGIQKEYSAIVRSASEDDETPKIRLSKTGKNVVVFMLDRSVPSMVPYIMNEHPELKKSFDGFTFYPNTISYGVCTNFGAPGLFGGYEYTPEAMNARTDKLLVEKNNEALKLMPALFYNAGYEVTVCDPPYANYQSPSDMSIFDEYPGVHTYFMGNGRFNNDPEIQKNTELIRSRNFFCYSLFKTAPLLFQKTLYNGGSYNRADAKSAAGSYDTSVQTVLSESTATGYSKTFMNEYAVLKNLSALTDSSTERNTFFIIDNETPHYPMMLQAPEFEPTANVDNTAYDKEHARHFAADGSELKLETEAQRLHYQVNTAALMRMADWFDYLRQNDLYDNTRIILVSDHGWYLGFFKDLIQTVDNNGKKETCDLMMLQCLLMVKDFNADGEFAIDEQFMTNADTPTLALNGLIDNPVNPFTGNPVNGDQKNEPEQHVIFSYQHWVKKNNGYAFNPDKWFAVHGDVRDKDSWEYIGVR